MKLKASKLLEIAAKLVKPLNKEKIRIWDVRTPSEFMHGHIEGAENVPFDELEWYLPDALSGKQPIVICSADDQRGYLVCKKLEGIGVEVVDGGDWEALDEILKQ